MLLLVLVLPQRPCQLSMLKMLLWLLLVGCLPDITCQHRGAKHITITQLLLLLLLLLLLSVLLHVPVTLHHHSRAVHRRHCVTRCQWCVG